MTEPSLPDKIGAIHERLDGARIPHAFGGALALAYYAEPRTTIDIDVNLFVPVQEFSKVEKTLAPLGIGGEVDREALERDGQCRLWWGRNPIDLFFSYAEIHDAMRESTRMVPFGEHRLPVLGPEHLLVCKAVFDRPKDWIDIEQMIVAAGNLDLSEIRRWLGQLIGDEDPRAQRFDRLVEELGG